jgi:ribosomal protein L2
MIVDIAVAADGNGRDGEYPYIEVEQMLMNKSRNEIQNIQYNPLKSALLEILVIFPTNKAFYY